MNNYFEKYYKIDDENEIVKSQLKEDKKREKSLEQVRRKVKKAVIKENLKNTNFSPFMKAFYKFAL